jgi:hypothetical protein
MAKKEDKKEEIVKKKEMSKENKTLMKVLIVIGAFFLILVVSFLIMKSSNQPKYNGMTFNVVKEGELTFYQTTFKVLYKGESINYNIYLRNNPRELEKKVPFEGELDLRNLFVLNTTTENLFCDGDWNLAIGNLQNLEIFNIEIMTDKNATCDENGNYMFVQIEEGEETKIEQYGPSCYKLIVSDCEILPVTERFMIEVFSKVNERLD